MNQPWKVLPAAFLERLPQIIPAEKLPSVLESFCIPKPPTFRTNTLKITTAELEKELCKRGLNVSRVPWLKDAFILNQPQKTLTETDLYTQGFLYLQNLSSMVPAVILDPQPGELVGDLAAAPGSKTTQLAALMQNTGEIIANDKSRIRLYKLEANLKLQGVTNTKVTYMAGEALWKKYPEYFDKMLVDVPCSLEGTFFCGYPKSYENWSPKKVKLLAHMQQFLLRSAVSATKPGGTIVYSTCTVSVEENEAVIDWILKKEGNALEIEKINLPIAELVPGIPEWRQKVFDPRIANTRRILPSKTMEGFFVAKIKKIRSTVSGAVADSYVSTRH